MKLLSHFTILTCLIVILLSSLAPTSRAEKKEHFKWDKVTYQGGSCVTLKDIKSFYGFKTMKVKDKRITLKNEKVEVTFEVDSQECYMNRVLFILSQPIVVHKKKYLLSRTDLDNLIDPVFRPNYIKRAKPFNTVIIDAGHGGKDSGSRGYYSYEKTYTLKIARLLRDQLKKRGYHVIMTRDRDVFISLAGRVKIANKHPDAIFVSIHFNSGNSRAHGIETFTISPVGVPHLGRRYRPRDAKAVPGNLMGSASIALATAVHSHVLLYLNNAKNGNNFKILDRGIKRARFNVLTGIKIPAILLEGGFLSNRREAGKINSSAYQKTLVAGIVRAIDLYKGSITKKKKN